MSRQFFVKLDEKYLKRMEELEPKINHTKNKKKQKALTRIQASYYQDIIQYTEARDYNITYDSNSMDFHILSLWLNFIAGTPIQVHTSLLANPHLSSIDKLVGGTIDTFVGFYLLTFSNLRIITVNLNIIAVTNKISLKQVQDSVERLCKWGGYFEHNAHLGH